MIRRRSVLERTAVSAASNQPVRRRLSALSLSAPCIASSGRTSIWAPLEVELDLWAAEGRTARFWWRDDDAVEPTAALDRLLQTAGDTPVALAIIPDRATEGLARRLATSTTVSVLQHGIAHLNHAVPPAKKIELGAGQATATMAEALAAARRRMAALFGAQFRPVLVPPWNRIADELVPLLPDAGFVGLSTAGTHRAAVPGLDQVNSHVDPIDWHGTRRCRPARDIVAETVRHLSARRQGAPGCEAPVGILTHHLLDDVAAERFAAELAVLVGNHPAANWLDAREIWPV